MSVTYLVVLIKYGLLYVVYWVEMTGYGLLSILLSKLLIKSMAY